MATIEVKDSNPLEAIQELLRSMLNQGLVSAILVPRETPSKQTVAQTLIRDADKLDGVNPLAPIFAVNSARIVARMCLGYTTRPSAESDADEPQEPESTEAEEHVAEEQAEQAAEPEQEKSEEQAPPEDQSADSEPLAAADDTAASAPIAVVLRPCEIRALVELEKLQQVSLEPFLVIGVDCVGTYSVLDYAKKVSQSGSGLTTTIDFFKEVTTGNFPEELRGACCGCQYPAPTYADLAIQLVGEDITKQIGVHALTDKGRTIFDALGLKETPESKERQKELVKLKEAKKQLAEQDKIEFLELISSQCINCKNCRAVCPICYCKQCVFDGEVFEYTMDKYLKLSGKKGAMDMPPDKILFHLTRMSHVAASCAACGQCEAACPSKIPLGRIYQRISSAAQGALDYEAGRSLEDELPLTTFREEELSFVES